MISQLGETAILTAQENIVFFLLFLHFFSFFKAIIFAKVKRFSRYTPSHTTGKINTAGTRLKKKSLF